MTTPAAPKPARSLAEGIATLLAGRASTFVLAIVYSVVVSRTLGPEGRGVIAVVTTTAGMLAIVAEMGIGMAYLHDRSDERARAAVLLSFLLPIFFVGVFVATAPFL